jgi:fatty-acyl-CoA synthase
MHLSRYISYWAKMRAEEPVLLCDGESITWAEFDQQASSIATALLGLGARKGDRIGCLLENRLEWCVAFAASIKVGAIFVPLNASFGPIELMDIAEDAGCALVFSTPRLMAKLDGGTLAESSEAVFIFDRRGAAAAPISFEHARRGLEPFRQETLDDSDVLAISYTSGTTGKSKGAVLTHASTDATTTGLALAFQWTNEERFLIVAPLAFTGGFICNLAPVLQMGACGVLEKGFDATRALDLVSRHKITFLGGVPAFWQRMAESPEFPAANLASLRNGVTGGAPVSEWVLRAYLAKGVLIRQSYGCTEGGGAITLPSPRAAVEHPTSCGPAMIGIDLDIRDDHGRSVAPGEVGEIWCRGPQVMKGYWKQLELTEAAFVDDWYLTGDLARFDDESSVVVVDRKKSMIISGGVNIYPAQVERALSNVAGVVEVAALGLPSREWGEELVAIAYGSDLSQERLLAEGKRLLGSMKAPKRYAISPNPLPRTPTNKIARNDLVPLFTALTGRSQ